MKAQVEHQHEERTALAWSVERFAREKVLKPLATYLPPSSGEDRAADMLAHMRALKRAGKGLVIRKVEADG